jgi:receptor protein-tyrosine kinase
MSLVERTLKKLQEAKGTPVAPPMIPRPPAREHAQAAQAGAQSAVPPLKGERQMVPVESTRIIHIDREALRKIDLMAPVEMEREVATQYQQIKRPLVASVLARSPELGATPHVIMMGSALPGEGKTFTSISLALSLALEKDIEVVLVDADVAKPHISRVLGMSEEPGFVDLLADRNLRASQLILRTNVPGLSVLPAGRRVESVTELLASDRMAEVMAQLAAPDGRRIVLLDSPPLLLSSESRVLAASAGQVVLVVRAESTTRQAVQDAIAAVGEGKQISLILNQSSQPPAGGYYGYGIYGDASPPRQPDDAGN